MCGIIGLVNSDPASHVNQALVDALTILQHRGQDAAGIVTVCNNRFNLRKDRGTVAEIFTQENVVNLRGNIGIGHVRYPTAGGSKSSEAQPLYSNFPFGIAIAHNGNLTNTEELVSRMKNSYRHVNTDSDSEVLLNVFADELQRRQLSNITPDDIFDSVNVVMRKCKGAYAVVILINRLGMLAFRDPNGIRPLCYGTRQTPTVPPVHPSTPVHSEPSVIPALCLFHSKDEVSVNPLSVRFLYFPLPPHTHRHRLRRSFRVRRHRRAGPAVQATAGREGRRGHLHLQQGRAVREAPEHIGAVHALHIRVRLLRQTRLDPGRRAGLRGKSQHGRGTGEEDRVGLPRPRHRHSHSHPRDQPHLGPAVRTGPKPPLPRRLHQKPLHRANFHHARAGDAAQDGATQAEHHQERVQGQNRATNRRLHRAGHHVYRVDTDGPRRGGEKGLLCVSRAAGALLQRVRHRHSDSLRTGGARAVRPGHTGVPQG
mmetsp:Transcript_13057/g.29162  ORF Transcript_13057/g.29162 Transcript_13057/m.29162 type:complete len:483 (+) Transcript_13057:119-1567(+)